MSVKLLKNKKLTTYFSFWRNTDLPKGSNKAERYKRMIIDKEKKMEL